MPSEPMKQFRIDGILPPMITPFRSNGDVDLDAFVANVERWNGTALAGYLVHGSNSETAYLDEAEKLRLIDFTVRSASPEKFILAGTGLESTRATIELTNKAARLGVKAALVLTPFFYKGQMSDAAIIAHFSAVADKADMPVLIYNVPKFTGVNISVEAVRVLSRHPNIAGMKDSKGDLGQLAAFKAAVPPEFNLLVGTASALYGALELGIRAGILALANCLPDECVALKELFDSGDKPGARELQTRLNPVNAAVTETFGVAGLKHVCTLLGFAGGTVRSPLLPLDAAGQQAVRDILVRAEIPLEVQ
jgi:4-hydroxy-2-oxoglutarate aldolase